MKGMAGAGLALSLVLLLHGTIPAVGGEPASQPAALPPSPSLGASLLGDARHCLIMDLAEVLCCCLAVHVVASPGAVAAVPEHRQRRADMVRSRQ